MEKLLVLKSSIAGLFNGRCLGFAGYIRNFVGYLNLILLGTLTCEITGLFVVGIVKITQKS